MIRYNWDNNVHCSHTHIESVFTVLCECVDWNLNRVNFDVGFYVFMVIDVGIFGFKWNRLSWKVFILSLRYVYHIRVWSSKTTCGLYNIKNRILKRIIFQNLAWMKIAEQSENDPMRPDKQTINTNILSFFAIEAKQPMQIEGGRERESERKGALNIIISYVCHSTMPAY